MVHEHTAWLTSVLLPPPPPPPPPLPSMPLLPRIASLSHALPLSPQLCFYSPLSRYCPYPHPFFCRCCGGAFSMMKRRHHCRSCGEVLIDCMIGLKIYLLVISTHLHQHSYTHTPYPDRSYAIPAQSSPLATKRKRQHQLPPPLVRCL
jgi:hypothetical protein